MKIFAGNLEATDEEIVEAAKAANVDHFIRGYNMEMNQESSNISLGQSNFDHCACALADPKILIWTRQPHRLIPVWNS